MIGVHYGKRFRRGCGNPVGLPRIAIALLALVIAIGVYGCANEDSDPNPAFSGITVTDEMGALISEDIDDWQLACPKAIPDPVGPPLTSGVHAAYPNPATVSTNMSVVVVQRDSVTAQIWAAPTRRGDSEYLVRTISTEWLPAGVNTITWDCKDENGDRVAPGIYRCRYRLRGCSGYGDIEVLAIAAPSTAARQYAAEHWSLQRQLDACTGEIDSPGSYFYGATSADELPQWIAASADDDAHYYAIGHCRQLVFGWDDYVDPREMPALGPEFTYDDLSEPSVSLHRAAYLSTK